MAKTTQRDWAEEDGWLSKVDRVLAEHEETSRQAASLLPTSKEPE